MKSGNTEILLHTAVKTEVEASNQEQNTNSILIGLQSETLQEDQKGFVMEHELYNGAGTQPQDTGLDIGSEESRDNVQYWESREEQKAEVSKGHLQIHGIGDYHTQDTIYDQLIPEVRDVLPIHDSKCDIQTKKCVDDQQIQIYNDPSNGNDIWEFLPIQDPRSNHQTQNSINCHPSQDMKHWTVTSTSLLPCVKLEGDGMTRNKYPDNTEGMLIKSENCSLDTVPRADLAEESRADVTITNQMPNRDLRAEFPFPIVIQPAKTSYQCTLCDEAFTCNSSLVSHQWTHSWAKAYKCTFCGKGFSRRSSLTRHERAHTGEKPYKCTFCGKGFSQPIHLKAHERIHTGEKPYRRNVSEKGFVRKCEMKPRQWTFSEEKRHRCTFCNKGFLRVYNLTVHELRHTGEKPYKCDVCKKRFNRKVDLKNHQKTPHTGEKSHKCDV